MGKLSWAAKGAHPDLSFEVVEMSSRFKQATVNDLIRANKCILKRKEKPGFILFLNLGDIKFLRIIVESDADAGHANMEDGCSSAGGQLIMLVGEGDKCCVSAWQSNKTERVVKSTLAVVMLSLSDALDLSSTYYSRVNRAQRRRNCYKVTCTFNKGKLYVKYCTRLQCGSHFLEDNLYETGQPSWLHQRYEVGAV